MKSKPTYDNIKNLHSVLKFFYYGTLLIAFINLIITLAIPSLPDSAITFERGIREWAYSVDFPLGIGSMSFTLFHTIPTTILQFLPVKYINVQAAIMIDSIISLFCLIILINLGLKKLVNLTQDILNNESPFQLKHIKSFRIFAFIVMLYSTLGNTVLCILFSIFVTGFMSVTFDFMWSGVFFGILGYIFSDIAEYGLFLQDEYDTTL
ncbi:hypothetical protein [Fusibacter ferrireducens]|uniref:DUF2975 domain-containing protein n=1 Tax=Fusibacter ferrireducens TaxID=2785058 RepID=A0ABR9ZSZ5_9FIRM|nr:hypothetical protein [Fusibacter ferrireducens]MBF4693582.1 hypothetical protein [Fusibacter ferrireducens]